jgi:hypothetical protein
LSDDITDTELEARLFASAGAGPGTRRGQRRLAEPDWTAMHRARSSESALTDYARLKS